MARWALADDGGGSDRDESQDEELGEELEDADDSALDVEEEAAQDDDADAAQDDDADAAAAGPSTAAPKLKKIKLSKGAGSDACHVCGQPGHFAGFVGARYIDCANKPCYLCGKPGHSTQSCPHRLAPELACTAAADVATTSMLVALRRRERGGAAAGGGPRAPPPAPGRWLVDAAVLKLHSRRTTCLEFHPTRDNIVLSGDKSGQIAVWDLDRVFERTVLPDVNRWLTNALRFLPGAGANDAACATCSYDGTVKLFDVEIGVVTRTLVDANPEGWGAVEAQDKLGKWITFIGMDVMPQAGLVVAGDSKGSVYLLDPRAPSPAGVLQVHRRNTKVQSVSVHPLDERLVLTAGNDYQARLLDARCLGGGGAPAGAAAKGKGPAGGPSAAEVASFAHARVVNAAYFSPLTGRKILSTAQDNRLR
jgi:DNA damage-binding protein 2